MSKTEAISLTKRGMLPPSNCNRLMDRSESLKRDSVMSNGVAKTRGSLERKKSKSFKEGESYSSWLITEAPGSIAAVRREQVAAQQALRKLKIAHYGRSKSTINFTSSKVVPLLHPNPNPLPQRCSFLTSTSGMNPFLSLLPFFFLVFSNVNSSSTSDFIKFSPVSKLICYE